MSSMENRSPLVFIKSVLLESCFMICFTEAQRWPNNPQRSRHYCRFVLWAHDNPRLPAQPIDILMSNMYHAIIVLYHFFLFYKCACIFITSFDFLYYAALSSCLEFGKSIFNLDGNMLKYAPFFLYYFIVGKLILKALDCTFMYGSLVAKIFYLR